MNDIGVAASNKEIVVNLMIGLGYDIWVEYSAFPQEEGVETTEVVVKALKDGRKLEDGGEDPQVDISISTYVCEGETAIEAEGRAFLALADVAGYSRESIAKKAEWEDGGGNV